MPNNKLQHQKDGLFLLNRGSFSRRKALALAGGMTAAALMFKQEAHAQTSKGSLNQIHETLGAGKAFDVSRLTNLARQLSKNPYEELASSLPPEFSNLARDQYEAIEPKAASMIWGTDNRMIGLQPLHRGSVFSQRIDLFTVEDGLIQQLRYDPQLFNFGSFIPPEKIEDIGFSGFRLLVTDGDNAAAPFAEFQGATFFRGKTPGQDYGSGARALILRPADRRGEEFPFFRSFWIERPVRGENTIICHSLIDSPSTVAVARFSLHPGNIAISDVELTLFPRDDLDHVGFGGLSTSYYFGETRRPPNDDLRLAAYKANGLQVFTGRDEWLWRPLNNPNTLQVSAFLDQSPKGFGFLQKSRFPEDFLDETKNYETRPSTWVEPLSDLGEGAVQLIEIPSNSEINENILAYWRPRPVIKSGSEFSVTYRLSWCWAPPVTATIATVSTTRIGSVPQEPSIKQFVVDFKSETFRTKQIPSIQHILETNKGSIRTSSLAHLAERDTIRVRFELDPENTNSIELRLLLKEKDEVLSETWLYRWTL